jgi:hypothetical protein
VEVLLRALQAEGLIHTSAPHSAPRRAWDIQSQSLLSTLCSLASSLACSLACFLACSLSANSPPQIRDLIALQDLSIDQFQQTLCFPYKIWLGVTMPTSSLHPVVSRTIGARTQTNISDLSSWDRSIPVMPAMRYDCGRVAACNCIAFNVPFSTQQFCEDLAPSLSVPCGWTRPLT